MASPNNDIYSVDSGEDIFGGRVAPIPNTIVLLGDSLTDMTLGNISPFTVGNGLIGGLFKEIGNIGVYGNTVGQMLSRIDNLYTAGNPGLAGYSEPIGWVEFRGGTNDARGGAISGGLQTTYDNLFAKILTYAEKIVVKPVPPIGGAESAANANVPGFNTYLQNKCSASNGRMIWVDDCVNVKDGGGNQISAYFNADGVHFSNAGVYQLALDSVAGYNTAISGQVYLSPISKDNLDKYPATPQWVTNHVNAGTSGSAGNQSGVLPTGWGLWGYGGGITSSGSIVTADVSDLNPTPWLRITPTQTTYTGNGEAIQISTSLSGRTITANDPSKLDFVVQVRFNNFNTNNFKNLRCWVQGSSGGQLTRDLEAKFGGSGNISGTMVLRHCMDRPTNTSQTGATLFLEMQISSSASGAMGSFDIRCVTVRG